MTVDTAAPGAVTAVEVAAAAQLACLLEASAPKPGNVSPARHFSDARYEDFLASAVAIGPAIADAGTHPLGVTIHRAVEATARWTRSNTNLGIVLLLAPLARAALRTILGEPDSTRERSVRLQADQGPAKAGRYDGEADRSSANAGHYGRETATLREAMRTVLSTTTVDDAQHVYRAIRLASPGGLGRAESQDVAEDPSVTLLEAMQLAAHRDGIAREYASTFETTFGIGAPALVRARGDGLSWNDAVVETFLTLLALAPDTHLMRRGGATVATEVSQRAADVLAAGGVRSLTGRSAIDEMDRALRDARNMSNPGTSADLTAAAIFVVLLAGGWTATH